MTETRIAIVSPVTDGMRCRALIGNIDLNTGRYTPPDLSEWQGWIDSGWTVEEYQHTAGDVS